MKVPSLLSDTFLLLTGAQPISSGERGPGAWSSWGRLGSRVLTLCSGLSRRGGAGRQGLGPAPARGRVQGPEGQKGGLQSAWAFKLCKRCGHSGPPGAGLGRVGTAGAFPLPGYSLGGGAAGISYPGRDARALREQISRTTCRYTQLPTDQSPPFSTCLKGSGHRQRLYISLSSNIRLGYTSTEKIKSLSVSWNMRFLDKHDSGCLQIQPGHSALPPGEDTGIERPSGLSIRWDWRREGRGL